MNYQTIYYLEIYENEEEAKKETSPLKGTSLTSLEIAVELCNYSCIGISVEELAQRKDNAKFGQFDFINDGLFCEPLTWYDYEEDMIELSMKFPSYVFVLIGIGEDPEDRWLEQFHNGDFILKDLYKENFLYREEE